MYIFNIFIYLHLDTGILLNNMIYYLCYHYHFVLLLSIFVSMCAHRMTSSCYVMDPTVLSEEI